MRDEELELKPQCRFDPLILLLADDLSGFKITLRPTGLVRCFGERARSRWWPPSSSVSPGEYSNTSPLHRASPTLGSAGKWAPGRYARVRALAWPRPWNARGDNWQSCDAKHWTAIFLDRQLFGRLPTVCGGSPGTRFATGLVNTYFESRTSVPLWTNWGRSCRRNIPGRGRRIIAATGSQPP